MDVHFPFMDSPDLPFLKLLSNQKDRNFEIKGGAANTGSFSSRYAHFSLQTPFISFHGQKLVRKVRYFF